MKHKKSGPFENLTKTDHSKSGHVRISDPTEHGIEGCKRPASRAGFWLRKLWRDWADVVWVSNWWLEFIMSGFQ